MKSPDNDIGSSANFDNDVIDEVLKDDEFLADINTALLKGNLEDEEYIESMDNIDAIAIPSEDYSDFFDDELDDGDIFCDLDSND